MTSAADQSRALTFAPQPRRWRWTTVRVIASDDVRYLRIEQRSWWWPFWSYTTLHSARDLDDAIRHAKSLARVEFEV